MDPKWLAAPEWQQVTATGNFFWFFALALVVAALSFGLAHAIIPSLVMTRQAGTAANRIRPVLYVLFAIVFVIAVYLIVRGVYSAFPLIRDIYPRYWI